MMSDTEFDVMDELYFVTPFTKVVSQSGLPETTVKATLAQLIAKEWVKVYASASEELLPHEVAFEDQYQQYQYLATKAGLLAHNGR